MTLLDQLIRSIDRGKTKFASLFIRKFIRICFNSLCGPWIWRRRNSKLSSQDQRYHFRPVSFLLRHAIALFVIFHIYNEETFCSCEELFVSYLSDTFSIGQLNQNRRQIWKNLNCEIKNSLVCWKPFTSFYYIFSTTEIINILIVRWGNAEIIIYPKSYFWQISEFLSETDFFVYYFYYNPG